MNILDMILPTKGIEKTFLEELKKLEKKEVYSNMPLRQLNEEKRSLIEKSTRPIINSNLVQFVGVLVIAILVLFYTVLIDYMKDLYELDAYSNYIEEKSQAYKVLEETINQTTIYILEEYGDRINNDMRSGYDKLTDLHYFVDNSKTYILTDNKSYIYLLDLYEEVEREFGFDREDIGLADLEQIKIKLFDLEKKALVLYQKENHKDYVDLITDSVLFLMLLLVLFIYYFYVVRRIKSLQIKEHYIIDRKIKLIENQIKRIKGHRDHKIIHKNRKGFKLSLESRY